MEQSRRKYLGIIFLIIGLTLGLGFSGNQSGFRAGDLEALFKGIAYIGGFSLAFVGALLLFYRERSERGD